MVSCTTSALFSALHHHVASLDRHAQLTRCFAAVAELLVSIFFLIFSFKDIAKTNEKGAELSAKAPKTLWPAAPLSSQRPQILQQAPGQP